METEHDEGGTERNERGEGRTERNERDGVNSEHERDGVSSERDEGGPGLDGVRTPVRAERSVFPDADPLPTVVIGIENSGPDPVVVHLKDEPPVDVPVEDVGFSKRELDRWRLHESGVVLYRRELRGHQTVTTTYYVRNADLPATATGQPTVLCVERASDDGSTGADGPDGSGETGRSPVGSRAADATNRREAGEVEPDGKLRPDGGRIEKRPDGNGPRDDDERGDRPADSPLRGSALFDSAFDEDEPDTEFASMLAEHHPVSWGDVARALADELAQGQVDEAVRADIRDALLGDQPTSAPRDDGEAAPAPPPEGDEDRTGRRHPPTIDEGHPSTTDDGQRSGADDVAEAGGDPDETADGTPPSGHVGADRPPARLEVRIERLESKVARLAAYTDAFEAFLDERGTGRRAIENLDERLGAVETALDDVSATVADLDGEESAHVERLSELETFVTDLADDVADVTAASGQFEGLDARTTAAEESIEHLRERLETVEETVDELAADRDRLDDAEDAVAENATAVEDLRSSIEEVQGVFDALTAATADRGEGDSTATRDR